MSPLINIPAELEKHSQVRKLVQCFSDSGVPNPTAWLLRIEPRIFEYPDSEENKSNVVHQRLIINRALRLILSSVKGSINVRLALIDDGEEKDWLLAIKRFVVPFIIENNLFD